MSADIVSTVMLSLASRTQQSVQIAVMRRASQMQQDMLKMIDDAPVGPPSQSSHQVDKRA